ncbi:MAG: lipid-A-disaccharide synthase [Proteobacteria bacterium]|nr:lipid-A-disaccharide synthase [Pseudomonadota bacterium]
MSLTMDQCIFISAGEYSGDLLAADLVRAFKKINPRIHFFGITGPTMLEAGVQSIASIDELSVMGILEVAKRLCDIKLMESRILGWIDRMNPLCVILVDAPGFHLPLAEKLKGRQVAVYQYVAPKVWAWGAGRVAALKDNFHRILGILPFEEDFFLAHGVNYTYVGSPHWDRMSKISLLPADLGLLKTKKIVAFLPGSRMSEINRILPEMLKIRDGIQKLRSDIQFVIPLAPSLSWESIRSLLPDAAQVSRHEALHLGRLVSGFIWLNGSSLELLKVADAAVVASGTATLECALSRTPMTVVYKMNPLTFSVAKRMVKLKWVSLVNLLMNETVVNEYLQDLDPNVIAQEICDLLDDTPQRKMMIQKFDALAERLLPEAAQRAASMILSDLEI